MKFVALGGSLRSGSLSAAALRASLTIAASHGATTEMLDVRTLALPVYVPDRDLLRAASDSQSPDPIEDLIRSFREADVMIWASPTYHGAISGALKNAIDYMQYLANDSSPYLQGKAVGLISIADPAPLSQMASCVHELRAWLAPTRLTLHSTDFSPTLELTEQAALRRMTRLVDELTQFRKR